MPRVPYKITLVRESLLARTRVSLIINLTAILIVGSLAACTQEGPNSRCKLHAAPTVTAITTSDRIAPPILSDDQPREYPGLHNVVAFHDGCYSGGVPIGDKGFEALAAMGVRTIISVDGAEPDVDRARARGLRYIHLPIGYNGFTEERKLELVRATRDAMQRGPVYIHCHHGKHRSAGAAGAVVASLGWCSADDAVARMRVAGTSPSYKGLYSVAADAKVLAATLIDAVPADFPEVSRPTGFVRGMIEIDAAYEHLRAIEKAGWKTPKDHPDLVPVAEAGRMADLFRVLVEGEYVLRKPAKFADKMHESAERSTTLETLLAEVTDDAAPMNEQIRRQLSGEFARITSECKDCHVRYRD